MYFSIHRHKSFVVLAVVLKFFCVHIAQDLMQITLDYNVGILLFTHQCKAFLQCLLLYIVFDALCCSTCFCLLLPLSILYVFFSSSTVLLLSCSTSCVILLFPFLRSLLLHAQTIFTCFFLISSLILLFIFVHSSCLLIKSGFLSKFLMLKSNLISKYVLRKTRNTTQTNKI